MYILLIQRRLCSHQYIQRSEKRAATTAIRQCQTANLKVSEIKLVKRIMKMSQKSPGDQLTKSLFNSINKKRQK